jgi:AraC-like DNA-binding protein
MTLAVKFLYLAVKLTIDMLVLNIVTLLNLLLLFTLLYFRKDNALPNKILALILINPGINFISNVTILSGVFSYFPYVFFFGQITCFAFAPLVHMYCCLLLGLKINYKHPVYIITCLAMLMSAGFGVEFTLMDQTGKKAYLDGLINEPYPWQMNVINSVFILLQQIYFTITAIKIYKHRKKFAANFSDFGKTRIVYAQKFIVLIWIFNLITITLYATLPMTTVEYVILPLVLTGIYFFILYYSFHHHSIFTQKSYDELVADSFIIEIKPEGKSAKANTLRNAEILLLAQQIDDYLNDHEPFAYTDFSLETLSLQMEIPPSKLSNAITNGLKKSFYDLINEKRVEKALKLLKDSETQPSLDQVAQKSGFNNRASFYRAFKKHTDSSPREYLKSVED